MCQKWKWRNKTLAFRKLEKRVSERVRNENKEKWIVPLQDMQGQESKWIKHESEEGKILLFEGKLQQESGQIKMKVKKKEILF